MLSVLFLVGTVFFGCLVMGRDFWKDIYWHLSPPERRNVVQLQPDESINQFLEDLQNKGLIVSRRRLIKAMLKNNADRSLRPGSYDLKAASSWKMARQLKETKPKTVSVTILPGADPDLPFGAQFTPEQQKGAVEKDSNWPNDLITKLPKDARARAAFLLPQTYNIPFLNADQAVQLASKNWWNRLGRKTNGVKNLNDLAVIASLVETEGLFTEELPRIAGVIYNRLAIGQKLQIDAAVVYAWKLKGEVLHRLLYKHLELDSPYNTYRIDGLPPTAIAVPGLEAWEAAFVPEKHDYYYYVADGTGHHTFTKTQKEHEKAVQVYRMRKKK